MKVVRIVVRLIRLQSAAGIASVRIFDFDDVSAEPSERLGTGRACFKLGEINNFDAL